MDLGEQISVFLVGVESPGNIGSVARAMKNFGFRKLVLFNPACEITSDTMGFAMHARDVVESAEIVHIPKSREKGQVQDALRRTLGEYDIAVGTTAKTGQYRNIPRLVTELPSLVLPTLVESQKIALVFGRESVGLTNDEISMLDFLVHIPASPDYPTLNISHAVAVVLYEVTRGVRTGIGRDERIVVASRPEKDRLLSEIWETIEKNPEIREHRKEMTVAAFKNVVNRAFITQKERNLMLDFFKKVRLPEKKSGR
ncbi:MAG: RNA methyltransferase [Promethearchaeota archaeon]